MEFLVRLVQLHESFRRPELEALATLAGVDLEILLYKEDSPFCIVRMGSKNAAREMISRSILSYGIYELWGSGSDYISLHADVRARTESQWSRYKCYPFRFAIDSFNRKRTMTEQRTLIDSFSYVGFKGPICLSGADLDMRIFEDFAPKAESPRMIYLGRLVGPGARRAVTSLDLKKRRYISTTSLDSEMALITANMVLAGPGRLSYDPFMGTGSLPLACAHFGAMALGSDIDGRSIRGTQDRNVRENFKQYGMQSLQLDSFVSDLTNTPLRMVRFIDSILCDPPYGIREGLKVLGKNGASKQAVLIDGVLAHLRPGYIPPTRPYSFEAMLDDILHFAANTLKDNGRLAMWMPTANDESHELTIPTHPALKLVSVCVQPFNKWSRRLLTYSRLPESEIAIGELQRPKRDYARGTSADELNTFRKRYFEGFRPLDPATTSAVTE